MNTKPTTDTPDSDEDDLAWLDEYMAEPEPDFDPEPPQKSEKERQKERSRVLREHEERFAPSIFEARSPNATIRENRKHTLRSLFQNIWHEGELCVLFGEPASGKTILATQIAESVARSAGVSAAVPPHAAGVQKAPLPDRTGAGSAGGVVDTPGDQEDEEDSNDGPHAARVLLLDLETSDQDFAARYTAEVPFRKRKAHYRFASNLKRAAINYDEDTPEVYEGRPLEYLGHSFARTADDTKARVIVIDNLTLLNPTATARNTLRWMRYLRKYCRQNNVSILVTYPLPPRSHRTDSAGTRRPFRISNSEFRILNLCDSAFALLPTTIAPDHRYLKPLKGRALVENGKWKAESDRTARGPRALVSADPRNAGSLPASEAPLLDESLRANRDTGRDLPGQNGCRRSGDGVVDSISPHSTQLLPSNVDTSSIHHSTFDIPDSPDDVHVLRLERTAGPRAACLPTPPSGVPSESIHHSSFDIHHSAFLGFTLLGPSPELLHLLDYSENPKRIGRPRKENPVIEMFLDPAYGRYLKGEK